jgi:putative ABC transport system permease protein
MRALDRKILRDTWKMRGQVLAIALVIASGISTYVMFLSTMNSLTLMRDGFYRDYRFAQVFASLKRAPESLRVRIGDIRGVRQVETRVVADVKLEIDGFSDPVTAKIVSVPERGEPLLNRLHIRQGRQVDPARDNEVIISDAFAQAHRFKPGDTFGAVINGRWKRLVVVGVALSPEFVLQVKPGAISPDYKRYAILWMSRRALANAYDMDGAFNDVVLTVYTGVSPRDVLTELDRLLERYGGLGSYTREDQMSHRYLAEEFRQLANSARIFPAIFIAVSAFLINVVLTRTINTQREQIAVLKAFGYSNRDIGLHYAKLVAVIEIIGLTGGFGVGTWLGNSLGRIYMEFYRFPHWLYEVQPLVGLSAGLILLSSALVGTFMAIRRAVNLPPAEAMRPEAPAHYRRSILDHLGVWGFLSQPTRIIVRNIERQPLKSFLSMTGIAAACAIMIAGTFTTDAVDFMVDVQFRLSQRQDMVVTFTEPTSLNALFALKRMPGIHDGEGFRTVPARLRYGHRQYRTSIQGVADGGHLYRLLTRSLRPVRLPAEGIVLTDYLAAFLGIRPGDLLTVEVLEGSRPVREIPVVRVITEYIGMNAYMELDGLNRFMREGHALSGAYLTVDSLRRDELYNQLVEMPRVAGTVVRRNEIRNFYDTQAEFLLFFVFVASILAGFIAFGVVYNSARIALAERRHELASLRVLGYTRGEISYIFLGELAFLTLPAIPFGFLLGRGLCSLVARSLESDLFRVPVVLEPATYSLAAAVVVVSAFLSGLIVRRKLDHLDLVEVLKAKE